MERILFVMHNKGVSGMNLINKVNFKQPFKKVIMPHKSTFPYVNNQDVKPVTINSWFEAYE